MDRLREWRWGISSLSVIANWKVVLFGLLFSLIAIVVIAGVAYLLVKPLIDSARRTIQARRR